MIPRLPSVALLLLVGCTDPHIATDTTSAGTGGTAPLPFGASGDAGGIGASGHTGATGSPAGHAGDAGHGTVPACSQESDLGPGDVFTFSVGGPIDSPCGAPPPEHENARVEHVAYSSVGSLPWPIVSFADVVFEQRTPPCRARIGLEHRDSRFRLEVGESLRLSFRSFPDGGIQRYAHVWEDSTGRIILASLEGFREGTIPPDLSQGLALTISPTASCHTQNGRPAAPITLSTPASPDLVLQPLLRTCAPLWGAAYDVETWGAWHDETGEGGSLQPAPYVTILALLADRVLLPPEAGAVCGDP